LTNGHQEQLVAHVARLQAVIGQANFLAGKAEIEMQRLREENAMLRREMDMPVDCVRFCTEVARLEKEKHDELAQSMWCCTQLGQWRESALSKRSSKCGFGLVWREAYYVR